MSSEAPRYVAGDPIWVLCRAHTKTAVAGRVVISIYNLHGVWVGAVDECNLKRSVDEDGREAARVRARYVSSQDDTIVVRLEAADQSAPIVTVRVWQCDEGD